MAGGASPGLIAVKRQGLATKGTPAVTQRVPATGRLTPEERKAHIAQVTDHEVFVHQKRSEATLRDITCKAVCATKRSLRQPGAQADGRPAIPPNWDEDFKPQLGSFMKFVLGRPDQFRLVEGSGPGFYSVENTAGTEIAKPPSSEQKAKGKGKQWAKGKPWGKGKASGDDVLAEKGKGKGKDQGKGKGASKADDMRKGGGETGKGKTFGAGGKGLARPPPPARASQGKVLPAGARLLAQAAKEELAAEKGEEEGGLAPEEEEEVDEEPLGEKAALPEGAGEEEVAEEAGEEDLAYAKDEDPDDGYDEDERLATASAAKRGTFIRNLLSSGIPGGGRKRPALSTAGLGAGVLKRATL